MSEQDQLFIADIKTWRGHIKETCVRVKALREREVLDSDFLKYQEADDNVLLAYRHLEDAAMRLGKAIQAIDGGVSVYDKKEV